MNYLIYRNLTGVYIINNNQNILSIQDDIMSDINKKSMNYDSNIYNQCSIKLLNKYFNWEYRIKNLSKNVGTHKFYVTDDNKLKLV